MFRKCIFIISVGLLGVLVFQYARAQDDNMDDTLRKAESIAKELEDLEARLIAIVQSRGTDAKTLERKRKAVELLGKIGTGKSVPVLIAVLDTNLKPSPDGVEIVDHDGLGNIPPTPAMKGLAALGPLAVEALVDAVAKETAAHAEQALGMLPCKKLVAAVLADKIERTRDEKIRSRLETAYVLVVEEDLRKLRAVQKKEAKAKK